MIPKNQFWAMPQDQNALRAAGLSHNLYGDKLNTEATGNPLSNTCNKAISGAGKTLLPVFISNKRFDQTSRREICESITSTLLSIRVRGVSPEIGGLK